MKPWPFGNRRNGHLRKSASFPGERGGFTLFEVVFASAISLLLFLVLFEALLFCRRGAANLKWRLAADALAYDVAWETFNRKTSWFEDNYAVDHTEWRTVAEDRTSAWLAGQHATYCLSVLPVGTPVTHWQIITDVVWPLPDGGWGRLPTPYVIERHRVERNLFRNTP